MTKFGFAVPTPGRMLASPGGLSVSKRQRTLTCQTLLVSAFLFVSGPSERWEEILASGRAFLGYRTEGQRRTCPENVADKQHRWIPSSTLAFTTMGTLDEQTPAGFIGCLPC